MLVAIPFPSHSHHCLARACYFFLLSFTYSDKDTEISALMLTRIHYSTYSYFSLKVSLCFFLFFFSFFLSPIKYLSVAPHLFLSLPFLSISCRGEREGKKEIQRLCFLLVSGAVKTITKLMKSFSKSKRNNFRPPTLLP